jgi:hypothetical protein
MSKIIFSVFFVFFVTFLHSQNRDTILHTVLSKPFFYNVIKTGDEKIYVGTADGIIRVDVEKLVKYNNEIGYVMLGKDGKPIINPEGIKNYKERKYQYFLPFPEKSLDEYNAGTNDFFYICSGGRLYIYEIVPFQYSFPNHSIRSISEHFVGTYSGIYKNGVKQKLPIPNFCDGYIREHNNKAFICYDWLCVVDSPFTTNNNQIDSIHCSFHNYPGNTQYRDVMPSYQTDSSFYFVATTYGLQKMYKNEIDTNYVYCSKNKKGEINLIGYCRTSLIFSDANYLLNTRQRDIKHIDTLIKIEENILGGITIDERNIYLLTGNGLYVYSSDKKIELLTKLNKAHTLLNISNTEFVIGTDNGLMLFNTVNRSLSQMITGVEFNRRALFLKNNKLYAGSINGLYTISVNDFNALIKRNKTQINKEKLPFYIIVALMITALIAILLLILLMKARKKITTAKIQIKELTTEEPRLNREQIECFIRENLANASLKSINDHFNTSNRNIYKIIEPDKPGSIIQKIRLEKVKEMNKAGRDLTEIAEATGLSMSYIRKIKGGNQSDL